jgi:FkbM family methyltransferase
MISYFTGIFHTRSFAKEPAATCMRSLIWLFYHIALRRRASVRIPVGRQSFILELPALLGHFGSTGVFLQRQYYEPLLEFCDQLIAPGYVVFDCGANQGIFTCAFATLAGPSGKVIAIEPQDYAVDAIRDNIRRNRLDNVIVEHAAVSDFEGSATLDISRGAVSASIIRDFGRQSAQTVPTVTLASVAEREGLDRIDLIKLDVEGAEYSALRGADDLLTKYKPVLVLEASHGDPDWLQVSTLLQKYDYQPHLFNLDGRLEPIRHLPEGKANVNVIFLAPTRSDGKSAGLKLPGAAIAGTRLEQTL